MTWRIFPAKCKICITRNRRFLPRIWIRFSMDKTRAKVDFELIHCGFVFNWLVWFDGCWLRRWFWHWLAIAWYCSFVLNLTDANVYGFPGFITREKSRQIESLRFHEYDAFEKESNFSSSMVFFLTNVVRFAAKESNFTELTFVFWQT